MQNGIRFGVIWFDVDATVVVVECSNGRFAGVAEIYLAPNGHLDIANLLSGFPSSVSDSRTIEMGTFNPAHADGGLRVELRCAHSSGDERQSYFLPATIKIPGTVRRKRYKSKDLYGERS